MSDTKTKQWIAAFVLTMVGSGALAAVAAEKNTYYYGTSVLTTDGIRPTFSVSAPAQISAGNVEGLEDVAMANEARVFKLLEKTGRIAEPSELDIAEEVEKIFLPPNLHCLDGETPIVKNGAFEGCLNPALPAFDSPLAAPPAVEPEPIQPEQNETIEISIEDFGPQEFSEPLRRIEFEASADQESAGVEKISISVRELGIKAPESCESQGKYTYSGPDRAGLLYGMCIDCTTVDFVQGGWACPAQ